MSIVAILGAGPIGGAIAHALARRSVFRDVRIIDAALGVAEGKALDIRQSGPIDHFDTRVWGASDVLSAAGASVIIIADASADGEWEGERGLALVRQLSRAGTQAPIVFAGGKQTALMETAVRELGVAPDRVIGSAPSALWSAARALIAAEVDGSPKDVAVSLAGRPPSIVVGWSAATVAGASVAERILPHRLLALSQALKNLWPCGPHAIGAATAEIAAGLITGSRQDWPVTAMLDGEFGFRKVAAILPVRLGNGRVLERRVPTLSSQERTEMQNAIERARG